MQLLRAMVDLGLYREVHAQPMWRTLRHLALLVLLATAALTVVIAGGVGRFLDGVERHVDKIPTITLGNGEASVDVPQPWLLEIGRRDDGTRVVLIIDTTGTWSDFRSDQVGLFLARRHLLVRPDSEARSHAVPLRYFGNRTIGPELARRWIARARWVVPAAVAAILFVWGLVAKTAQALLLTIVASMAAGSRRRALHFSSLFTIAVYALTPAVVLAAGRRLGGVAIPWFIFVYWGIAALYAALGASRAAETLPPDKST
jgi:hypothetical protein